MLMYDNVTANVKARTLKTKGFLVWCVVVTRETTSSLSLFSNIKLKHISTTYPQ